VFIPAGNLGDDDVAREKAIFVHGAMEWAARGAGEGPERGGGY
jgi:hypothetical protein